MIQSLTLDYGNATILIGNKFFIEHDNSIVASFNGSTLSTNFVIVVYRCTDPNC